jgi:hypothetical protein
MTQYPDVGRKIPHFLVIYQKWANVNPGFINPVYGRFIGKVLSKAGWWVGTMEFYFPFHIWDVILPIDELICFKIFKSPPTSIYFIVGYGSHGP